MIRLRGLGTQHKAVVIGIVVLLWVGPLFNAADAASNPGLLPTVSAIQPHLTTPPTALYVDTAQTPAPAKPELVSFALNSEESFYTSEEERFDPQDGETEEEFQAGVAGWRERAFAGFTGPIARRTDEGRAMDYALARAMGIQIGDPSEHEEYFGTGDSATMGKVLEADSATRESLRAKLFPVYDLTVINRGKTTTVLFATVVHAIHFKDSWGADWPNGEVPPSVLNVLHRYPVRLSELVDYERGTFIPDTLQVLPPVELPPDRAARIQVQFLPHYRREAIAFVGRLCLLFHGAQPVCTPEFATLL